MRLLKHGVTVLAVIWAARVVLAGSGNPSVTTATPPLPSGKLVQAGSLVHQGSFHVPTCQAGNEQACFEYGGTALIYNPTRNSLFITGHDHEQLTGEISIPAFGATATLLQTPVDLTAGKASSVNPGDPNDKKIGGGLVWNGQLVFTVYAYYDGAGTQVLSHFVRPLTLASGSVTGPLRVGSLGAGFYSGYMGTVPAEWQPRLGGPALTGQADVPITSRTSLGPAAFAFDPGNMNSSGAQPLVYYPIDHPTLGVFSQATPYYSGNDLMRGVVFPNGTSSVLFFGRHGTTMCYGPGTDDPSLNGKPSTNGADPWCYDPGNSAKGSHGYPYVPQVWAYDANDLASVRSGSKKPWNVKPYAVWTLPGFNADAVGGAAYDPDSGRIYISERYGDEQKPLIHVYAVQ